MNRKQFFMISPVTDLNRECKVCDPAMKSIARGVGLRTGRHRYIVKKRLKLSTTLYEMLQILSLTMLERIPLDQLLAQAVIEDIEHISDKQLILFE